MGYSAEALRAALAEKRELARKREAAYEAALAALHEQLPELTALETRQKQIGAELISAAFSGNTERLSSLQAVAGELEKSKAAMLREAGLAERLPDCPLCRDTGYHGTVLCDCVKALARARLTAELSLAVPLTDSGFDSFELAFYPTEKDADGVSPRKRMTAIRDFCVAYADGFGPGAENLLFLGSAGLGKTHLSLAIVGEVLKKGYGVIYNTAQDLFLKLEEEYFSHAGNSTLDALLSCDLLVLDDLGTEFSTQFTQSSLYHILNTRLLQKKPTILSTNLSLKGLEERYTARVSSRLIGGFTIKKFAGQDIRQLKMMKKTGHS